MNKQHNLGLGRIILFFCIVGIMPLGILAQSKNTKNNNAPKTYRIEPMNGELIIDFPVKPENKVIPIKDADGKPLAIVANYFAIGKRESFAVIITDKKLMNLKDEDVFKDEYPSDYLQVLRPLYTRDGWRIEKLELTSKNSIFMSAWNPVGENNFMHSYSVLTEKNGWQYNISCSSRLFNEKADIKVCNSFFNKVLFVKNNLKKTEWYSFSNEDKDFTINAPAYLVLRGKPQTSNDFYNYQADTKNGHFGLVYADTPISSDDPFYNSFPKDAVQKMSKYYMSKGGQIIGAKSINSQIYEIESWRPSDYPKQSLHSIERYITRNGRLYTIACSSRNFNVAVDRKICNQYFSSFKLLK